MFEYHETPVIKSCMNINNNEIYIKREDLIPYCFGGNKIRIADTFIDDMLDKGMNYMIGYGSPKSNLSRALAYMCASKFIPCTIISSQDEQDKADETYNSILVNRLGANLVRCSKNNVKQTVEKIIDNKLSEGYKPYYIYGDSNGKGNEVTPINAYVPVYDEIVRQAKDNRYDYIFLACGTGMTYSGLICGKLSNNGSEQIIGISIARSKEVEIPKIHQMVSLYAEKKNISLSEDWLNENIIFTDEYLCGGYSEYNKHIVSVIDNEMKNDGIAFDSTYTGKAFWGMQEYIKKNNISDKKILFINTGGTTLYFDYLKKYADSSVKIKEDKNYDKIFSFLKKIDLRLPTSLSSRVDLKEYTDKLIDSGSVLSIENENGDIVGGIFFYCNDMKERKAYVSIAGIVEGYEGRGYGSLLMSKCIEYSKKAGMKELHLDTEKTNDRAIFIYKKLGFVVTDDIKKVHMVKEL